MRIWQIVLALSLISQPISGWAQTAKSAPTPIKRHLRGLTYEAATALLTKLEDAQRRVKAGEFQSFELLAGSIASYDKTEVSPREAFLEIPFKEVWSIERFRPESPLWQRHKLVYSPGGRGQLDSEVEVVLGIDGNLQRVLIIYKPPAPF